MMKNHTIFYFRYVLLSCFVWATATLQAQAPEQLHAGELLLALKKMNTLGSVLYWAAHPDDENTAAIAYFANDRKLRTGYLSLTRGDGGQNLIGAEQGALLGLIRTQELLQARRTDRGEQFFTRANDFGFSKHAEETFEKWDREQVLADAVWVIRQFRPDVIITRFPPNREAGHGHHEASAILALEAFEAAADPTRFPEQLAYVQPWQAKRVLWNAYSRRRGQFTNIPPDSTLHTYPVDLGRYSPLLGKSYQEIAAESRSMHKSQGFGSAKTRGERIDHFVHMKGDVADGDMFEGIDLTWERLPNSQAIANSLAQAVNAFDPEQPEAVLPFLLQASAAMETYLRASNVQPEAQYWIQYKKQALEDLILQCAGLWCEANAQTFAVSNKDSLKLSVEVFQGNNAEVMVQRIDFEDATGKIIPEWSLSATQTKLPTLRQGQQWKHLHQVWLEQFPITQPYWLRSPTTNGLFDVKEQQLIGLPENLPPLTAIFTLQLQGRSLQIRRPITYKWVRPDEGELYRPLEITPELMVSLDHPVYAFANEQAQQINLTLKSGRAKVKGILQLELPTGWRAEPAELRFDINEKDVELPLSFRLYPPSRAQEGGLRIWVALEGQAPVPAYGYTSLEYRHIPTQTLFPACEAKVLRLDLQIVGQQIGYIQGAGDNIPTYLRQVGYQVTELQEAELKGDLQQYDAIVVGVRTFNISGRRNKYYHPKLLEYVRQGGTLLMQYHTSYEMKVDSLGPFPFEISRGDRVTVEEAPVEILHPEHKLMNYPNKITYADFEAWVQERGLYFAKTWDKRYTALLSTADPNEESLSGGLLYTNYGKGQFIYTGYAFFRQLPAGVGGAYRLFANLIAPLVKP
ncbi:PIG-L family deacetylase [Eisenibacter elegans]|uniref:PIG-L family deacetylase n=1 Tax=Eisenibacter elegans TaxID=997 RepID=UPI0004135B9D|nr:PIG-L family deacetylase [Eisenibacter elegans]